MPELPEIASRACQMDAELTGKTIAKIKVIQPKSLNIPVEQFTNALTGARIERVSYRGKWIEVETSQGWLLLSLGMGGEILLVTRNTLPPKYRLLFEFSDDSLLSINFWWFGYAHYVPSDQLASHKMTSQLGPNALDLSAAGLKALLHGQRKGIKTFLLDQSKIAGIGNAYIHDILFLAGLHPLRPIHTLSDAEIDGLAKAIHDGLQPALEKGGAFYEADLYGQKGGFQFDEILVGYREGQACPHCGATIQKIKTGSTSSFICPNCQK